MRSWGGRATTTYLANPPLLLFLMPSNSLWSKAMLPVLDASSKSLPIVKLKWGRGRFNYFKYSLLGRVLREENRNPNFLFEKFPFQISHQTRFIFVFTLLDGLRALWKFLWNAHSMLHMR
jgi:hypothetical protein